MTIRSDLRPTALVLFAVVALCAFTAATDPSVFSLIVLALALALAWWSWPGRVGSHTPHDEVAATAGNNVVVYWRPG